MTTEPQLRSSDNYDRLCRGSSNLEFLKFMSTAALTELHFKQHVTFIDHWRYRDMCFNAALHKNIDLLRWLFEQNQHRPLAYRQVSDMRIINRMIRRGGGLDTVKLLCEESKLECNAYLMSDLASESQGLEYMQYLFRQTPSYRFNDFDADRVTKRAAVYGNLQMLQWLHEHGCPLVIHECIRAAEVNDQRTVVDWLRLLQMHNL